MPFNTTARLGSIFKQPRPAMPTFGQAPNPYEQGQQYQPGRIPEENSKRLFSGIIPEPNLPPPRQIKTRTQQSTDDLTQTYFDRLQEMSKPGPAQTAYQEAVTQVPSPQDYAPSVWRRIGASITGAAGGLSGGAGQGVALGENFLNTPYRSALSNYQERMKGLESAADLEMQGQDKTQRNYGTALTLAESRAKRDQEYDFKGQELEVAQSKEERELMSAISEAQRRSAQTSDEAEKRQIERDTLEMNKSLNTIRGRNLDRTGLAAQTTAGAAATRAATDRARLPIEQQRANSDESRAFSSGISANADAMNAETRANQPPKPVQPPRPRSTPKDARTMALDMLHEDAEFTDALKQNANGFYEIRPNHKNAAAARRKLAALIQEIMYGAGGAGADSDDIDDDNPYEDIP